MPFQAKNRCLMASVWWASDLRVSSLGLILAEDPSDTYCMINSSFLGIILT